MSFKKLIDPYFEPLVVTRVVYKSKDITNLEKKYNTKVEGLLYEILTTYGEFSFGDFVFEIGSLSVEDFDDDVLIERFNSIKGLMYLNCGNLDDTYMYDPRKDIMYRWERDLIYIGTLSEYIVKEINTYINYSRDSTLYMYNMGKRFKVSPLMYSKYKKILKLLEKSMKFRFGPSTKAYLSGVGHIEYQDLTLYGIEDKVNFSIRTRNPVNHGGKIAFGTLGNDEIFIDEKDNVYVGDKLVRSNVVDWILHTVMTIRNKTFGRDMKPVDGSFKSTLEDLTLSLLR